MMALKTANVSLVLIVIAAACAHADDGTGKRYVPETCLDSKPSGFVGAVIRQDQLTGKFYILDDETHTPQGIRGGQIPHDSKFLYPVFEQEYIEAPICDVNPDETLAPRGYIAGASVGLQHMAITGRDIHGPLDWNYVDWGLTGNLFVMCNGGRLACAPASTDTGYIPLRQVRANRS